MSDCCGNPGVGIGLVLGAPDYETYNPGEVRLYGRPALGKIVVSIPDEALVPMIQKELEESNLRDLDNGVEAVKKLLGKYEELKSGYKNELIALSAPGGSELYVDVNILSPGDKAYIKTIGVIYGYAYEGHCYKLPKPQIMYLPAEPKTIVGGVCGCDCGYTPELGYAVWQIDMRRRIIALDIRSDDVKTLILDENMPGNRSPQAYSQSMSLAPMRSRE
ncbi:MULTISPECIES: hypothetical protein [Rhizobium]|uniref:Uncharacterized protein n=1 Tax=Rhizobium favelukesii TaxID=348824 RepID=W6RWI8_9HYPH|nr:MULTISPECIES: hypothetical protein [Rhizobium]MCA0805274.1 hypothetical protein [Rhizobium sp. T1473]MCS0462633.1 hypothetical protein [Rhizobium favelukesii]UFS79396.1 hypothetical protein LPB79_07350 [Rhizobium sp. T136]CDM62953.1 hypothetical protein LPU83_pLPU83d_1583 [Rhizobium favelukesii]